MLRSLSRVLLTLVVVAAAGLGSWYVWRIYMLSPWTRDGRVRTEVVGIAPEISGNVSALPVVDNQFVHKGDLLFSIDPASFRLAVDQAQAVVDNRQQDLRLRQAQAGRRAQLNSVSVSVEEREQFEANALIGQAALKEAQAALAIAQLNLQRTAVRSPVNGWVTNLLLRIGDYASTGRQSVTIIDADAFWVSGYFEETKLSRIREGAPVTIALMGESRILTGHVESFSRGITDPNAASGGEGLANVSPTFTWVRLAQRIPVRIAIDRIPEGVRLAAGMTCTLTVSEADAPAGSGEARPSPVGTAAPR